MTQWFLRMRIKALAAQELDKVIKSLGHPYNACTAWGRITAKTTWDARRPYRQGNSKSRLQACADCTAKESFCWSASKEYCSSDRWEGPCWASLHCQVRFVTYFLSLFAIFSLLTLTECIRSISEGEVLFQGSWIICLEALEFLHLMCCAILLDHLFRSGANAIRSYAANRW